MNKSFLKIFFLTFTLVLALYGALFEITNPHVTGFFNSKAFRPWHINLEYAKFEEYHRFQIPDGSHWKDVREVTVNVGSAIQKLTLHRTCNRVDI